MSDIERRKFLGCLGAAPLLLTACGRAANAQYDVKQTVANDQRCAATAPNIEGPFFKPGAPLRTQLAPKGTRGEPLALSGMVVGPDCKAIKNVAMEIWQADHTGAYDNAGDRFRARLELAEGRFAISTIVPGRYLNGRQYRPAHLHIKLRADGFAPLTTQLYFPGDPYNSVDPWFKSSLLVKRQRTYSRTLAASYQFALAK